jgi:integrase
MAIRHGNLYRRGKYFYFKYKNETGNWKELATHKKSVAEAYSARSALLKELEGGGLPNDRSKWSLEMATAHWLEARKLRVAPGSFSSERTIVRNLLRGFSPEIKLVKLADKNLVQKYESERLQTGVKPKTVNNEIVVLAGILREANLWHRIASDYRPLKVQKSDVGEALTREEGRRLLQNAAAAPAYSVAPCVAVLSYATGLRSCEIKKLQLKSIHLEGPKPYLYVTRASTKTDRGARYVALDQMACWALGKLIRRAGELGASEPMHYLLPTQLERHTRQTDPLHGGTGFDVNHPQSSWEEEWRKLRKKVGIEGRRFHDLRHSYITRAAEAGVPLAVTQAQVGHMSVQMVQHYTHICHAAIHFAADQIEKQSHDLLLELGLALERDRSDSPTGVDGQIAPF